MLLTTHGNEAKLPVNILFCNFAPAVSADRESTVFVKDVDFDVAFFAPSIPGVFAAFA